MSQAQPITLYLPDTRGVVIDAYGRGNTKIGPGVFTYSRLPGKDHGGTCPGSTPECESICYAKRVTGPVHRVWQGNSYVDRVPGIPAECRLLRLHISGDFSSHAYIEAWIELLERRPDVTCWAYTRSWRVPALLPVLENLRSLPNVQLFASVDPSTMELPPPGWRRAWIWRTFDNAVATGLPMEDRLVSDPGAREDTAHAGITRNHLVITDMTPSLLCPEETGHKANCESCRYCFDGRRHDVTFIEHDGE